MVTVTVLLKGSVRSSQTRSNRSSALTTDPSASRSTSRTPRSLRVNDNGRPVRLTRRRARSKISSPRTITGVDAVLGRRDRAWTLATSSAKAKVDEVIIGAQVEPLDPVIYRTGRGEHQDASLSATTHQCRTQGIPVHPGQVPIQHHHVVS
jgi:hypothetical protein